MSRVSYADSIVRAAELIRAARRSSCDRYPVASVAAAGSGSASDLRTRVLRLLDASFREELSLGRGASAALVVVLAGLLALAVRLPARAGGPAPGAGAAAASTTRPSTKPAATPAEAAQAALERLRPQLPTGWSLRAKEGVLSIRRDKGLLHGDGGPGGGLFGGAPGQKNTRYPYRIDLRFEQPMTVEEFRRRLAEHKRANELFAAASGNARRLQETVPKVEALRAANPVPDLFDVNGGSGHGIYVSLLGDPHGAPGLGQPAAAAGAPGYPGGYPGQPGGNPDAEEYQEVWRVRQQVLGSFRREPDGAPAWVDRLRAMGPMAHVAAHWLPPADAPRPHVTSVLLGEQIGSQAQGEQRAATLQSGETSKLIDLLAEQGFFERATDDSHAAGEEPPEPTKSGIIIQVVASHPSGAVVQVSERLPLNDQALRRLRELGKRVGGEPAEAVNALLREIESHTEPWVPAGPGPASGRTGGAPPPGAPPGAGHDH